MVVEDNELSRDDSRGGSSGVDIASCGGRRTGRSTWDCREPDLILMDPAAARRRWERRGC